MSSVTFDTHKFIRKLREPGMPDAQAEAVVDAFREAQGKADVSTKSDLRELELRLTIKIGGMLVIAVGVLAAVLKLQQPHGRPPQLLDLHQFSLRCPTVRS